MTKIDKVRQFRKAVQKFIFSSVSTDEEALEYSSLYPKWEVGHQYGIGDYVTYEDVLYKVIYPHASAAQWLPPDTPTMYKVVEMAEDSTPIWSRPLGYSDAYNTNDIVWYPDANGNKYKSLRDGNVWSPEEYPQAWLIVE